MWFQVEEELMSIYRLFQQAWVSDIAIQWPTCTRLIQQSICTLYCFMSGNVIVTGIYWWWCQCLSPIVLRCKDVPHNTNLMVHTAGIFTATVRDTKICIFIYTVCASRVLSGSDLIFVKWYCKYYHGWYKRDTYLRLLLLPCIAWLCSGPGKT